MTSLLIAARRLVAAGSVDGAVGGSAVLSPGFVRVEGGILTEVSAGTPGTPADLELADGVLAPGLVDLQVNGCFGHDLADTDPAGWADVVRRLPETGVTAFLPTFITAPVKQLAEALWRARDLIPGLPEDGARVIGVHLEGPFLSGERPGAHEVAHFTDPTRQALDLLLEPGIVRLVTLAPERTGAIEAVRRLTGEGVLVSLGHTDATAEQAAEAAAAGARMVTHLFNAQTGVHHKNPGVAARALTDPRLHPSLILDLHHVAEVVCRLVFAAVGDRLVLVTDAVAAAGMPPGRYHLGGEPIELPGEGPPVRPDGTIAGSALRLDTAVRNAVGLGVPLQAAVDAASRVPADLIGRPDLGRLAPGARADLVWLDEGLRARMTWIAGRPVFSGGS